MRYGVYVGYFNYPDDTASSTRIKGVVDLLEKANYRIEVISAKQKKKSKHRALKLINVFMSIISVVINIKNKKPRPEFVIIYGNNLFYLIMLPFFMLLKIKVVYDLIERYEKKRNTYFDPFYCASETYLYIVKHISKNCICITNNFYNFTKCANKILLPVVYASEIQIKADQKNNYQPDPYRKIVITYAGKFNALGYKKEAIEEICIGFDHCNKKNLELILIGGNIEDLNFNTQKEFDNINRNIGIKFYGLRSKNEVYKILSQSDFIIIPRPNNNANNFGFPTKLSEGLMFSNAVIATKNGDIPKYVSNENGVLIESCNAEDIKNAFTYISGMSFELVDRMKLNSRIKFDSNLKIDNYVSEIKNFVTKLK